MATKNKFDFIGMILSVGCIIHCLLLPIIIPFLPSIGFIFDHNYNLHLILVAIIYIIAILALIPGRVKHGINKPIALASFGIALITSMGVLERFIQSPLITIATIIGSSFIVTAHYFNHKYSCACKHHH